MTSATRTGFVALALGLFGCSGATQTNTADAGVASDAASDWTPGFSLGGTCGKQEVSVQTYCSYIRNCEPLDSQPLDNRWTCLTPQGGIVTEQIDEGCGYVRFSYVGDVSDSWGRIYDQVGGQLIYLWNNGRLSFGCTDSIRAGQEPTCETWTPKVCPTAGEDGGTSG
jgi:hypothetical protein